MAEPQSLLTMTIFMLISDEKALLASYKDI